MSSSRLSPGGIRGIVLPYLTPLAHGSAPFISTFLLIHLTAPIVANLGGSSLSSQVMDRTREQLLGREYYQTKSGETYLVLAPLVIHPLAAVVKRLLSPKPLAEPRPLQSMLSVTGYLSMLVFVPVHYLTHRLYPSLPSPPIYAVGPGELDYEFVKTGLRVWPGRSWALYVGLVACVALHSVEGMSVIWRTWVKRGTGIGKKWRVVSGASGALMVLSGVWVLAREPLWSAASSMSRFEAAYTQSLVYRL